MNSAKKLQEQLEIEYEILEEYRNIANKISSILVQCKCNEDPIKNLAGLFFNVEKISHIKNDLTVSQMI